MSITSALKRAKIAYAETGAVGVVRRVCRVSILKLESLLRFSERLLYDIEAEARLSGRERHESSRAKAHLTRLFQGSTVFVLGTGPSMNDVDLVRLAAHRSIGVNSFFRHPITAVWNPTVYCFMDGDFFVETVEVASFFKDARAALPDSDFCVTSCDLGQICQRGLLPYERTYCVPTDGDMSLSPLSRLRLGGVLPCAPNAVLFATVVALLAGAKTIVLLGTEHDWLARPNPIQQKLDPHFYEGMEKIAPPPDSRGNTLENYLATINYCQLLWKSYYRVNQLAHRLQARVLNATPGSFLDVFDFVDFEWAVANL